MNVYDASRCAMRKCVCTDVVSEIVRCWFSGSPKNSTKLWLYMLSSFELLSSSYALLASMVDWLFWFLFLRVASSQLRSVLNFIHCKGLAALSSLSSLSSITKKRHPTSLCNTCIRAWVQIDIPNIPSDCNPKHACKLTFLSVTDTYVHMHMPRIDPTFKASRLTISATNR